MRILMLLFEGGVVRSESMIRNETFSKMPEFAKPLPFIEAQARDQFTPVEPVSGSNAQIVEDDRSEHWKIGGQFRDETENSHFHKFDVDIY